MLNGILKLAGYSNVAGQFNREQLLKAAGSQLKYVETKRSRQGRLTNWNLIPVEKILDWVFGCDIIIDVTGNGEYYAIDATLNPAHVAGKVKVLNHPVRQKMLKAIGVKKVAVILFTAPSKQWGWALASDDAKLKASDDLIDQVIIPLSEDSRNVVPYHIHLIK